MFAQKSRDQFEARFPVPSGVQWCDEHQNYGWVKKSAFQKTITYRALWTGWQESRADIEVELPTEQPGYMYYAPDIVSAIEAAGLKVKP